MSNNLPKNKTLLSVVIPAYNEERNFKRGALDEVVDFFKKQKFGWEVILVNDGSTDKTPDLFKKFASEYPGFKVLDIPHGGKVMAVKAGVMNAVGEYVLFTDFDQSTPISEVTNVLTEFERGNDVVIGERVNPKGWSTEQKIRSKIFNLLVQIIALPGINDTQCGFKAFKNEIGKKLFQNLEITMKTHRGGYMGAFDVELLYLARKLGYSVKSIAVPWKYYESDRLSKSEPIKMLRDIVQVKMYDLFSGYKIRGSAVGQKHFSWHLIPLILIVILTIPAVSDTLTKGYFPMHDDLQFMRQYVMDNCFKDGQIPCRWSKDLGLGYGYPLFNYYPPLPYYVGQTFRWGGLSYVDTIKALVVLNFVLSGIAMYFFAEEFWGRLGGIASALLIVYAPYHSVDIYVRGDFNEAWTLVWFPLIYLFLYKLISTRKWWYVPLTAFVTAGLLLTHNPILMIFAPTAIIWGIFWLWRLKGWKVLPQLILAALWTVGLAAFFTLPVLFEQRYAHVDTLVMGYFNYLAHFADLNELFLSTNWGYGASVLGPNDGLSFQIGYLQWILAGLSATVAGVLYKKNKNISLMIFTVLGMTIFYTFMTHQKSSFIWAKIQPLEYLQFPWRFLIYVVFGASFLAGSIFKAASYLSKPNLKIILALMLIATTIGINQGYFRWKTHYYDMTDQEKLSGQSWQLLITASIFDYLPIWAPRPPKDAPIGDAGILGGQGTYSTVSKNSFRQVYNVDIKKPSIFEINTFYFPGWKYYVNNKEVTIDPYQDKLLGRPQITLSPGHYQVEAVFTETPIRELGDILSGFSWAVLVLLGAYCLYRYKLKYSRL